MMENAGKRPAEIFGYPIENASTAAQDARDRRWCPFMDRRCDKKSRLIDSPFGVCSVEYNGNIRAVCQHRFEQPGSVQGVPRVLEDIALHYFGSLNDIIIFPEVRLPNVGSIDYVLVRHKSMKPEVEDFISVEFQSDSTTSTGELVQGFRDFLNERDLHKQSYKFGMNTYDLIKRAITQLMNKGIVYEAWNTKGYWVIQEYIYNDLVKHYGFKKTGFAASDASRFALYDFVSQQGSLSLNLTRCISTTVEEVYQALRYHPGMPRKDQFVQHLNNKLRLSLQLD